MEIMLELRKVIFSNASGPMHSIMLGDINLCLSIVKNNF